MKLVESILTKNPCYTAGRKITVKGLMLHSVGCPQPKASVFINSWNSPAHDTSCVHGFIDGNDGTAYQTLPWNHRGWHCGSGSKGSGNNYASLRIIKKILKKPPFYQPVLSKSFHNNHSQYLLSQSRSDGLFRYSIGAVSGDFICSLAALSAS